MGIDYVNVGGTVTVQPGIYTENINFKGKNLVLKSADPNNPEIVSSTIIDGRGKSSVVVFGGAENASCVLEGFTIVNGSGTRIGAQVFGGAIFGNYTNATIRKNDILNNSLFYNSNIVGYGGGISHTLGIIERNRISRNKAAYGGGISYCFGVVRNNIIDYNVADINGGGIAYSNAKILNNNITSNYAEGLGGGIASTSNAISPGIGGGYSTQISNCILWANHASSEKQINTADTQMPTYCCIQDWADGGTGNINQNPNMVFLQAGLHKLMNSSPCVNTGLDLALVTTDWDGDVRPSGGQTDIGVDEFTGGTFPPTPTGLVATPGDYYNGPNYIGNVHIQWNPVTPTPTGYNLYYANTLEGPYVKINSTPIPAIYNAAVAWVPTGPRYYWCVTALGSEGANSAIGEGTPLRVIFLDPGHGGSSEKGAIGRPSRWWGGGDPWIDSPYPGLPVEERLLTRLLSLDIRSQILGLPNNRAIVAASRSFTFDEQVSQRQRPLNAFNAGADYFLSLHFQNWSDLVGHVTIGYPNTMKMFIHDTSPYNKDTYGGYTYPRHDQANLQEDLDFGDTIAKAAWHGYGMHAIAKPDIRKPPISEKEHFMVLRDSLLMNVTDPQLWNVETATPWCRASLIEVNYIRNEMFHYDWNDGPAFDQVRNQTARHIAIGLCIFPSRIY